ncbi:carbonic anhydrase [Apodospora peruviana]|uniref:Carbonic anhydrase n=1 Tax=Apodospora peruviana TaxID=516989 RepID=A0AAE0M3N8_9PEZI|nr:carbonic anhydrase [Apodospora peruviana]
MIVACLDPRCDPTKFFNLDGYEAIVHRNAGGNIRHALRDILMLDRAFDLNEVAVVHHTDCGTLTSTDEQIRTHIKARVDKAHWAEVDAIEFGSMVDVEESVKTDVEWFRTNPLVREELKQGCQGFVLDTQAGKVQRVDVD